MAVFRISNHLSRNDFVLYKNKWAVIRKACKTRTKQHGVIQRNVPTVWKQHSVIVAQTVWLVLFSFYMAFSSKKRRLPCPMAQGNWSHLCFILYNILYNVFLWLASLHLPNASWNLHLDHGALSKWLPNNSYRKSSIHDWISNHDA